MRKSDKEIDTRISFHSIESILEHNPHKIKKVFLPANRDDDRINILIKLLNRNNIPYELSKKIKQEPVAQIKHEDNRNFKDLKEFIEASSKTNPLILILDNIIDPRNLGACIRSAAVSGIDALIINKHQCAPINALVHKVSAGGIETLNIFHVSNLVNCLKYLKNINIKIYGLSEHSSKSYLDCEFDNGSAIVMGSEESGIREKTLDKCDQKINLSNNNIFKSFNVSVATGIILSEAIRQRKV